TIILANNHVNIEISIDDLLCLAGIGWRGQCNITVAGVKMSILRVAYMDSKPLIWPYIGQSMVVSIKEIGFPVVRFPVLLSTYRGPDTDIFVAHWQLKALPGSPGIAVN